MFRGAFPSTIHPSPERVALRSSLRPRGPIGAGDERRRLTAPRSPSVSQSLMSVSPARTITDAARLGTVLGIWAHPDDEAMLTAGLMAAAREAGNRVVCVTATLGEHGTDDPGCWPPGRLARIRECELRALLAALGVTEHHLLGLTDGTCAAAPFDAV